MGACDLRSFDPGAHEITQDQYTRVAMWMSDDQLIAAYHYGSPTNHNLPSKERHTYLREIYARNIAHLLDTGNKY